MTLISPPMTTVQSICGSQKVMQDIHYRRSKHCIFVCCEEGKLLYHTLTGTLLLLQDGKLPQEVRQRLIQNWFLVPEDFDEQKHADDVKKIVRMLQPKPREKTDFTILTTTDCNARCFYCYELGIRRFPMSEDTARETAQYIVRVCGGKPVKLRWFGGEPLYNRKVIDIICGYLRESGIEYESSMISNGYYLDAQTVSTAREDWHLKKIQITIDGTEDIYNRTKAYIDAEGSPYERVMENIRAALRAGIKVTIRLNMDARNAEDLLLLLDDIRVRFKGQENLDIYVALLHEFSGKIHRHEYESQTEQAYYILRDKVEEMGMLRKKKLPADIVLNRCMADNEACETILPDGRIGRCEHFSEAIITGHIKNDERDAAVERAWKESLSVPECAECVLYPQCRKLKLCEWNRDGCKELDQKIRINELKHQILDAYREYRRGEMNNETEE